MTWFVTYQTGDAAPAGGEQFQSLSDAVAYADDVDTVVQSVTLRGTYGDEREDIVYQITRVPQEAA